MLLAVKKGVVATMVATTPFFDGTGFYDGWHCLVCLM